MHKLFTKQYPIAAPLLKDIGHQTAIFTVLSGETPGSIYIDQLDNPAMAFAQFQHRAYISGSPKAISQGQYRQFILDEIYANCNAANVPMFRLVASDPAWITFTADSLSEKSPILSDFQCYRYGISSKINTVSIPQGFVIRPVNAALLNKNFKGKPDLIEEMCSERESLESFLEHSFGVVALVDDQLAGWCLSEYNFNHQCEVGIATLPNFQRHGLATAMAQTFINQARINDIYTVLWHCSKSNTASGKTALRAGFDLYKEEQVLIQYTNQAIHLGVQGNIRFFNEKYKEALPWYQKALSEKAPPSWVAWNAACAAAQTDQIDSAFEFLELAIELGFSDLDHLTQNKYMSPLKGDPRWGIIITKLTNNLPE